MNTGFWAGLFGWLFGKETNSDDLEKNEDLENFDGTEEFRCESCNKKITEEEYY